MEESKYCVICFDPGDHTGWVVRNSEGQIFGGTIFHQKDIWEDIKELKAILRAFRPDVIVYETFSLYPGAAKHLAHNEFYPVQMIGVIQTFAYLLGCAPERIVRQAPSIKKFSGGLDERWIQFCKEYPKDPSRTEHTKDAYLHLRYFELHNEAKIE